MKPIIGEILVEILAVPIFSPKNPEKDADLTPFLGADLLKKFSIVYTWDNKPFFQATSLE